MSATRPKRQSSLSKPLTDTLVPDLEWEEEEIKAFRLAFDMFDVDGDGYVDLDELDAGFAKLGKAQRQSVLVRLVETIDKDANMKLDFEEFCDLMKMQNIDEEFRHEMEEAEADPEQEAKRMSISEMDLDKILMSKFGDMLATNDIRRGSVYGNLAPVERSGDQIVQDLKAMDGALELISDGDKKIFIQAKAKCPELLGDKIKIMFLRAEHFNGKAAATRFVRYWEKRLVIMGPDRAFLPLTQAGAFQDDGEILSRGILNLTGKKDDEDQVVLYLDLQQHDRTKFEKKAMVRQFWYVYHAALEEEDAQKHGIVILVRAPRKLSLWDPSVMKEYVESIRFCLPTRLASGHVINPPAFVRVMFRIINLFAGNLRAVRKTHNGSPEKVLVRLQGYGIHADVVPKDLGGELVIDNEKWLKDRKAAGL